MLHFHLCRCYYMLVPYMQSTSLVSTQWSNSAVSLSCWICTDSPNQTTYSKLRLNTIHNRCTRYHTHTCSSCCKRALTEQRTPCAEAGKGRPQMTKLMPGQKQLQNKTASVTHSVQSENTQYIPTHSHKPVESWGISATDPPHSHGIWNISQWMRYTVPVKPLKMFRISLQAFLASVEFKRRLRYIHPGPFTSQILANLPPRVAASVKDSKLSCGPKKENRQHELMQPIRVLSCLYPYYTQKFPRDHLQPVESVYSNSGSLS